MLRTYTNSNTTTYTDARARHVMGKVHDDLIGMQSRGLLSKGTSDNWKNTVLWFMQKQALIFFEFQFSIKGEKKYALKYILQDGDCFSDDNSGGIDYWDLPNDTVVSILISWDRSSPFLAEIQEVTKNWGTSNSLTGNTIQGNIYSKDGYGLNQQKIGW